MHDLRKPAPRRADDDTGGVARNAREGTSFCSGRAGTWYRGIGSGASALCDEIGPEAAQSWLQRHARSHCCLGRQAAQDRRAPAARLPVTRASPHLLEENPPAVPAFDERPILTPPPKLP